jgi:uridine kinase
MKPFTIGITGGSGSGKTFFLKNLSCRFSFHEICLISQDHYYKPRHLQIVDTQGVTNFDLPDAIERQMLYDDILQIKKGVTLKKKEYTFNNPTAEAKIIEFAPAPILVIEGLFVQYFPEIEKELDLKVFIEAKDHLKLSRRIRRDSEERGYDLNDVLYRFENHVMPIYETLIEPLKHQADIIIPNNSHMEKALDVLTSFIRTKIAEIQRK